MSDDARLDRIENKVDNLAEVVTSLARMEERMISLFKRMDKYDARQDKMDDRLETIELGNHGRSAVFRILEKAFWLLVGAMITAAFKMGLVS